MGFGPDQLRDKALLALEEALQEVRYDKVRRSLALRFALAYLWACRPGNRAPFDEFWKALSRKDVWSFGVADHALGGIYRAVGVERDHNLAMHMWKRAQERYSPIDANGMLLPTPPDD